MSTWSKEKKRNNLESPEERASPQKGKRRCLREGWKISEVISAVVAGRA
jgi:hypothetical protein